jgi:hypothetical protein
MNMGIDLLKQIIIEELNNVMKETMISPSDLAQRAMNDPNVSEKIKAQLQDGIDNNDPTIIKQTLELLGALYPEYADEAFTTNPEVTGEKYKAEFDAADQRGKRSAFGVQSMEYIKKLIEPFKEELSDVILHGGMSPSGTYDVTIRSKNLKALRDLYYHARRRENMIIDYTNEFGALGSRERYKVYDIKDRLIQGKYNLYISFPYSFNPRTR